MLPFKTGMFLLKYSICLVCIRGRVCVCWAWEWDEKTDFLEDKIVCGGTQRSTQLWGWLASQDSPSAYNNLMLNVHLRGKILPFLIFNCHYSVILNFLSLIYFLIIARNFLKYVFKKKTCELTAYSCPVLPTKY